MAKTFATTNPYDVYNAVRNTASLDYQSRIPVATQNNIADVWNALDDYEPSMNEFLFNVVNKIGLTIVTSKIFNNPLSIFYKGKLRNGATVEELFINLVQAEQYDPEKAEKTVLQRALPDVRSAYHTLNYQNFYKLTVPEDEINLIFLRPEGIFDFISRVVERLYTSSEWDLYLTTKQLAIEGITSGHVYPVTIPQPTSKDNIEDIIATANGMSNKLTFMSTLYNYAGVATRTPFDEQYLLVDAMFEAKVGVKVLAEAFNMNEAQYKARRTLIDDFGELNDVVAMLVDKDFFQIWDKINKTKSMDNGEGLYRNFWFHVWKIFSSSPFANAIVFTTSTSAITSVTVTGATTATAGSKSTYTATVVKTGYASEGVVWSIEGGGTITSDGVATFPTAGTYTVTATSVYDSTKSGSAEVTVS